MISLKGYDCQTKADVGNACNDLVLKGGATKEPIIDLKIKMVAYVAKTYCCVVSTWLSELCLGFGAACLTFAFQT